MNFKTVSINMEFLVTLLLILTHKADLFTFLALPHVFKTRYVITDLKLLCDERNAVVLSGH